MTTTPAVLNAQTTEYVYNDITVPGATTISALNLLPVSYAFLPTREARPTSGDWVAGSWVTGEATTRCLVGPAGGVITLATGVYFVWVKIVGSIEQPVRPTGVVRVD